MKLAIVILNWNGKKLLSKFLPSVTNNSNGASIHLIDNASNDDSVNFVSNNYPSIHIIQNESNAGYARGYNEGLKHINADVFCLLNNDVKVSENWLNKVIKCFEKNVNTVIVQPKILDLKSQELFEYAGAAGGFIDKYGYPYCRGRIFNTIEKDTLQYEGISDIFWASGACLFIRKSVFNELNGFDESFFAHHEEIDLCWRAKNLGYTIKYVSSSPVYHLGGGTLNAQNSRKTFLNFRNSLFNITKNASGNLFSLVGVRLFLDGIAGLNFLVNLNPSHTLAIICAHLSYYQHLPALLKKRKKLIQKPNYFHKKSIIWCYFILRKKFYNSL
jgi:GT2 family glycosyltransferase